MREASSPPKLQGVETGIGIDVVDVAIRLPIRHCSMYKSRLEERPIRLTVCWPSEKALEKHWRMQRAYRHRVSLIVKQDSGIAVTDLYEMFLALGAGAGSL